MKSTPVPQTDLLRNRKAVPLSVALIVLAALAAYSNSFSVPLLLDDDVTIGDNPSIRKLWPIGPVLSPPSTVYSAGRPLLNLTFALNYAWGGTSVQSYHAVNLLIHILAGITLLGVVRRTLLQPTLREKFGPISLWLALAIALLWTLHPLQTESVTYISQRAESLMGLCYLATLYCFIRGAASPTPRVWYGFSVATCALGMGTKEVMVTAPLLILLYDRTFVAGTFRTAWKERWPFYVGLAATWLLLAYLMASSQPADRGVGYNGPFTWWSYAWTECFVVIQYLKLALWPHPLVFDYGYEVSVSPLGQIGSCTLLVLLLSLTLIAWRCWPAWGFFGAWYFLVLSPTSTIVPIAGQPMAENRIYLPLVAVVTLGVIGVYTLAGRKSVAVFLALALAFGWFTVQRNQDYRSVLAIWEDTVSKRPASSRAHNNLGNALANMPDRLSEAITHLQEALRIKPNYVKAHSNLGNVLLKMPGREAEAIIHLEKAAQLRPDKAETRYNLGIALAKVPGREVEAIFQYEEALRLKPDYAEAHCNLGGVLSEIPGRLAEAIAHYEEALKLKPADAKVHSNLGDALAKIPGRLPEAITQCEQAVRLKPDYAEGQNNLGLVLSRTSGRKSEAIAHYEEAIRLKPDFYTAHNNLGTALVQLPGHIREAITHFETAVRLKPDYAEAQNNLGNALLSVPGRLSEAIAHYEEALRLKPDNVEAHCNLGAVLANIPERRPEAIDHFEAALRLRPDFTPARQMLDQLRNRSL